MILRLLADCCDTCGSRTEIEVHHIRKLADINRHDRPDRPAGVAVHDGFTPYRRYGAAHQLCNAHHLRELAAVLDVDPGQAWAERMIRLLTEINDMARHARAAGAHAIEDRLLGVCRDRYQEIITAGQAANRSPPGHGARSPAANLLARLGAFADDVLRFAHDLRVPFDNNLAERDIRMVDGAGGPPVRCRCAARRGTHAQTAGISTTRRCDRR